MKRITFLKSLLLAAGLMVGASAWGDDLPTPVYFLDFEGASAVTDFGGVQHGSGSLLTSSDANFGKYYQNWNDVELNATPTVFTNFLEVVPATNPWAAIKNSGSNAFTVSFWCNATVAREKNIANDWGSLFVGYTSAGTAADREWYYSLGPDLRSRGQFHYNNYGYVDNNHDDYLNTVAKWRDDDKWHHFAWVFSGLDGTESFNLKLFLDGTQVYSVNETITGANTTGFDMLNGLDRFVIGGASAIWADPDNAYGYDDIALYSSALTSSQVNTIIECKTSTKTKVTYDFATKVFPAGNGKQINFVLQSNTVTTVDNATLYVANDFSDLKLYNQFAFPEGMTMRRGSSNNATAPGTWDGLWNGGGRSQRYFSIRNLHVGDKVTVYGMSNSNHSAASFRSVNVAPQISTGTELPADGVTEYTITSGTQLDLQVGYGNVNSNYYIYKVEISSPYDAVSNPSIEETGVDGTTKIVTITNGSSSHSNTVTTYYTIDGTTPSASNNNGSFVTASQELRINNSATVQAICISTDETESYVVSLAVEAGAKTPLNTPTAILSGMAATGEVYYPIYTFNSDNSDLAGAPVPDSYSYTFTPIEGEVENGTLTDAMFTFTKPGTVEVVAVISNNSYIDSEAKSVTVTSEYIRTQYVDVADFYTNLSGEFPTDLEYDLIANVSFNPVNNTQGLTYRTYHNPTTYNAYFARNKDVTVTCSGLVEGMVAIFGDYAGKTIKVLTENGSFVLLKNSGTFKYYSLYVLPSLTKSVSVSAAGLATYTSDMSLDYSTVSASVIPYKATVEGKTVTLTKATVVPAGEGVLLRSINGGAVSDVSVPVASYSAWTDAENAFVGTIKDIMVNQIDGTNTNFVLSKEGETVGFFKAKTEEDGGTKIGAGKAYLPVPTENLSAGARNIAIVFDDVTTGIENVVNTSNMSNNAIYNLSGQRVNMPTRGLYIMDGKKVIIK